MPTQGTQWRSHRDFNKSTALLLCHLERKSRKIPVCSYQEVTFIFTLKQNILLQFCCFPNVNHSSFISVSFYSTVECPSLSLLLSLPFLLSPWSTKTYLPCRNIHNINLLFCLVLTFKHRLVHDIPEIHRVQVQACTAVKYTDIEPMHCLLC